MSPKTVTADPASAPKKTSTKPAKAVAPKGAGKPAEAVAPDEVVDVEDVDTEVEIDLAEVEVEVEVEDVVVDAEAAEPEVAEVEAAEEEPGDDESGAAPAAEVESSDDSGFVYSDADDDDAPAQQVVTAGATADPVKDYLKQIGKVALLNAEQEVELAKRIEAGLFAEEKLGATRDSLEPKLRRELEWIAQDDFPFTLTMSFGSTKTSNKLPLPPFY